MAWLPYHRYFAELDAEAARLADVVRRTDPKHRVPTCPEWTFTQLTGHVGMGLRWAAVIVEQRATRWLPQERIDDRDPPDGADAQADWLLAGARRLGAAVRECGPSTRVWTWSREQSAGFWLRKLSHETVIHRMDAELAVGLPVSLAPDVAADGVSDLLLTIETLAAGDDEEMFTGLRGDGQTLHLHATDDGLGDAGEWFVRRTPSGVEWEHGHRKADVAVRGPALDLLLVLNRRSEPQRGEVLGDAALFEHWLRNSAF